jgi:hypothetical protein
MGNRAFLTILGGMYGPHCGGRAAGGSGATDGPTGAAVIGGGQAVQAIGGGHPIMEGG